MLVVHANWSDGALRLWAESLDACRAVLARGDVERDDVRRGAGLADGGTAVAAAVSLHPFAASVPVIADALRRDGGVDLGEPVESSAVRLTLPAAPQHLDRPLSSDRLVGIVEGDEARADAVLADFEIPCLTIASDRVISVLLALEDGGPSRALDFGHSLRYWMRVARFVLELLVDQRFIPTLIQTRGADLRAAWQPWLHDEWARTRVGGLLAGMPPVVRAVRDASDGQPWPILDEAMRIVTDATVRRALTDDDFAEAVEGRDATADLHVTWLQGLLAERDHITPPVESAAEMLRDVGRWIAGLDDTGQDRPLRLCLQLNEPDDDDLPDHLTVPGDDICWHLSFHLTGSADGGTTIDAEEVWRNPAAVATLAGGGSVRNPEELLLEDLGRAARVYPTLETALSQAEPAGIDLKTSQVAEFLNEFKALLEESGFSVLVPDWWGQPSAQIGARLLLDAPELEPQVPLAGTAIAGQSLLGLSSLVKYRWQVAVGDKPLDLEDLEALVKSAQRGSLVRLHGRWVELNQEEIVEAAEFFRSNPGGETTLLEAIQLGSGAGGRQCGLPVFGLDATGWVADLLGASSGSSGMPHLPQPEAFVGTLRPYQEVGLSWLAFLDRFGLGACLADDMGLGKTIQLIALLLAERADAAAAGQVGPTLLVVPTSVVGNWQRELERFAPQIRIHVQHGPDRPVGDQLIERAASSDIVITTYTLVSRDRETLLRMVWHRVVLDEAQYIKNPPTKQTATIRALKTARRVALTGTPVENRLSELWSIMEFCNPGYLGPPGEFRRRFSVPIERHRDQKRAEQLRRLVQPFVLRRLKTDPKVITDLPPCVITKEFATLTTEQAALYERTVSDMMGQVSRAEGMQRRGLVLATLVKLKQICNHPAQMEAKANGSGPIGASADGSKAELLSGRSGKCARLMEMLEEVLATGDKALLFTQFRQMGHLLDAMIRHDLDSEVMFLHGGTPPPKRQQMIDRFQDPDGGVPIFVLSLKAGGIGVNLTAANHVFHFDRWWNPAVENQATDRAFRIGQTRTVHVHKFVCMGTLEERIDEMIEQKTELAKNIIGAGEDWLTELSTGQLRDLLALRQSAMEVTT